MLGYKHSGFSVDAGCALNPTTVQALERLALLRPPTLCDGQAAQRGKQTGVPLRQAAQRTTSDKRGAKVDELHLTPLELIDRIAALVPRHAPTGTAILACWHQLAAQGCGDGAGDTGASRSRAGRVDQHGECAPGWYR